MKYTKPHKGSRLTESERKEVKRIRDNRRKGGDKRQLASMLACGG